MIAEDYEPTRLMLKDSLLVGEHVVVAEAKDGVETLEKFYQTKPDVLLLDIAMPKKDGIWVLKEIITSAPDAKVIMLTAIEDMSAITECVTIGAQAYLIKPFKLDDMLNAIKMALA